MEIKMEAKEDARDIGITGYSSPGLEQELLSVLYCSQLAIVESSYCRPRGE